MSDRDEIREKNKEIILAVMNLIKEEINYEAVSELLPQLLANGLKFDPSVYLPTELCLGRYRIYDHPDKENPFSIWVFALGPGQKTSIHDHQYEGTVTILQGPMTEKYYKPKDDQSAELIDRCDRHLFHTNRDDLSEPFVHQLKRRKKFGEGVSVSLHIYKMKADCVNEFEVTSDRRNLKMIYTKAPFFADKEKPQYRDEYADKPIASIGKGV